MAAEVVEVTAITATREIIKIDVDLVALGIINKEARRRRGDDITLRIETGWGN